MELPWNICAYCGTPAPGMRKEGGTLDDVVRSLSEEKGKVLPEDDSHPALEDVELAFPDEETPLDE
jgi:hypothetical protein